MTHITWKCVSADPFTSNDPFANDPCNAPFSQMTHSLWMTHSWITLLTWMNHSLKWLHHLNEPFTQMTPICLKDPFANECHIHSNDPFTANDPCSFEWPIHPIDPFTSVQCYQLAFLMSLKFDQKFHFKQVSKCSDFIFYVKIATQFYLRMTHYHSEWLIQLKIVLWTQLTFLNIPNLTWKPLSADPFTWNDPFTQMNHSLQMTHSLVMPCSLVWPIHLNDPLTQMTHSLEWPIHWKVFFSRPINLNEPFTQMTHSLESDPFAAWPIHLNDPFTELTHLQMTLGWPIHSNDSFNSVQCYQFSLNLPISNLTWPISL